MKQRLICFNNKNDQNPAFLRNRIRHTGKGGKETMKGEFIFTGKCSSEAVPRLVAWLLCHRARNVALFTIGNTLKNSEFIISVLCVQLCNYFIGHVQMVTLNSSKNIL